MSECNICVEVFNLTTREPITCVKCDFVCCKSCFKRYITDPEHLMRCMSCSVDFDRTSLASRLGQTFMRTVYRDIRQDILYEQEKAYFPATQTIIERELEIERLKKNRDDLDEKYKQMREKRMVPLTEFRESSEIMEVKAALDHYLQLRANVEVVDVQLNDERAELTDAIAKAQNNNGKPSKRTYVLACTTDNCKGMLSNESKNKYGNYVCAICANVTCSECQMALAEPSHECCPDVLATVEYMRTTSKPCPSCGIPIHKISGCNQMFCTGCHASFDWRTMRLNNGAVHNPHHAEWLRNNRDRPREVLDVQCAMEPDVSTSIELDRSLKMAIRLAGGMNKRRAKDLCDFLFTRYRSVLHHHHITLVSLGRERAVIERNQALRIQFLKGEIDEASFKRYIQISDKSASKRNELLHVVMLWRDAFLDLISPFTGDDIQPLATWESMIEQVKELETYVNACFEAVSQTYNSVCYRIMSDRNIR